MTSYNSRYESGLPISLAATLNAMMSHVLSKLLTFRLANYFLLPWQVFPSPVYPVLQVQIYDPRVLEQLAFKSHTGEEALHSSKSTTANILIDEKNIEGHLLRP